MVKVPDCDSGKMGSIPVVRLSFLCKERDLKEKKRGERIWTNGKLSAFQAEDEGSIPSIRFLLSREDCCFVRSSFRVFSEYSAVW